MVIQLSINGPRGEDKIIHLCEEEMKKITVHQLKNIIIQELTIYKDIRMVFRTEPLEESTLLTAYGIRHMSTIHTLLILHGGV